MSTEHMKRQENRLLQPKAPEAPRPPVMAAAAKPQQALPLQVTSRPTATIRLLGRWDVTLAEARAIYDELRAFFSPMG